LSAEGGLFREVFSAAAMRRQKRFRGFPARRLRRRANYRVRFRFFDWWIKFGKTIKKV